MSPQLRAAPCTPACYCCGDAGGRADRELGRLDLVGTSVRAVIDRRPSASFVTVEGRAAFLPEDVGGDVLVPRVGKLA